MKLLSIEEWVAAQVKASKKHLNKKHRGPTPKWPSSYKKPKEARKP